MGGNHLLGAGVFLVQTLFFLVIVVLMLRFLLQLVRADPFNPLSQMVLKLTNPLLMPLRNYIPRWGKIDLGAGLAMLLLKYVELKILTAIGFKLTANLFIWAAADLIALALNILMISIFVQVLLSWIAPYAHNPVLTVMYRLNEPLLGRVRRTIPPIAGLDLSPLLVLIGLQLLSSFLLVPYLKELAKLL
ncbi:MAG: YggT family protein [Gammaproteobacteria bacterium]|nr:YggT family protein [Gammaproteobacteria bacterium]